MLLFAAGLGAMLGMLIAGLVSLRPDRIVLIRRAHAALKRGNWIVAVHPAGAQAADAAMQVLRGLGTDPKRSL